MAAPKVFVLTVQIHVHKVYCRGARLRPWGPIRIRALTLHSSAATQSAPPNFPLLFHEGLIFRQVIQCAVDMKVLEEHLKREVVKLQLTQGPEDILLAQLTTSLSRVLFPKHPLKCLPDGTELELLMTPTSRFQSALGPRIELSTRMLAELCSQEESPFTDVAHGFCLKPEPSSQENPILKCDEIRQCSNKCLSKSASHYDLDVKKMSNSAYFNNISDQLACNGCVYCEPEYNYETNFISAARHQQFDLHRCKVRGSPICDICSAYDKIMKKRFPCSPNPRINKYYG